MDKHTYTCGIVDRKDIKRAVIDSVKESNATPQQQQEAGMRQSLGKKSGKYMWYVGIWYISKHTIN